MNTQPISTGLDNAHSDYWNDVNDQISDGNERDRLTKIL